MSCLTRAASCFSRFRQVRSCAAARSSGGEVAGRARQWQYFAASCPSETMCIAVGANTYNGDYARVIVGQAAP